MSDSRHNGTAVAISAGSSGPASQPAFVFHDIILALFVLYRFCMKTIVLVEDNEDVREFCQIALSRVGYNVLVAEDGASALALSEGIDREEIVLLTDALMPGMTGWELSREFVRRHPTARVGVISGWESRPELIGLSVLCKPFSIAKLLDFVATLDSHKPKES